MTVVDHFRKFLSSPILFSFPFSMLSNRSLVIFESSVHNFIFLLLDSNRSIKLFLSMLLLFIKSNFSALININLRLVSYSLLRWWLKWSYWFLNGSFCFWRQILNYNFNCFDLFYIFFIFCNFFLSFVIFFHLKRN